MPVTSKAQYKLMQQIVTGKKTVPGLTKAKAKEFLTGVNYEELPETSPSSRRKVARVVR